MDIEDGNLLRQRMEQEGFAVLPHSLDEATVNRLSREFDDTRHSERNLLSLPIIQRLAKSRPVRHIAEAILGAKCFAVRGILFNKTQTSNWKVVWHQDLTIAVRERKDAHGFGPWTMKDGVLHVQPPTEVMNGLIAIRLHLDESGLDNGPLRILPGSHREGRLSLRQVGAWEKGNSVICTVPRSGALVMRPLILHASSACAAPKPRRVIHLEFATADLPNGLDWYDRV